MGRAAQHIAAWLCRLPRIYPSARSILGAGFLFPFITGLDIIFLAFAKCQPASEPCVCLRDSTQGKRYESEVGESDLALFFSPKLSNFSAWTTGAAA